MKNLSFNLLMLLCSLCSFAQTGFIEVTVTDTIWMTPASFEYLVGVKSDNGWAIYPPLSAGGAVADSVYNEGVDDTQYKQKLNDLKAFLTKKKYTFTQKETIAPNLSKYIPDAYSVTLKNNKELQKLKADLKLIDYSEAILGTDAQYDNKALYEADMYKKLISRAREKANAIGAASGLKVIKVTDVKEVKDQLPEYLNIYDTYYVFNKATLYEDEKGNVHGELTQTITVRFAAE